MSEGLLFGAGFVIFVATTTATLLFGYFQFNRLYREDRVADTTAFSVATDDKGLEVQQPAEPDDLRATIARRPEAVIATSVA